MLAILAAATLMTATPMTTTPMTETPMPETLGGAASAGAQPAPRIRVFRVPAGQALPANRLCRPQGMIQAFADAALLYRDDGKAKVQDLGDLPMANHEKAVAREVAGCANPLVVQYGAGR